jgi:pentatricopeptide repeat protein
MALYAHMQQRGLQPNAVVYGTLVHAAGEVGRWEQALELMVEAAQQGISLDVQGYTAAIDACAASFQVSVTLASPAVTTASGGRLSLHPTPPFSLPISQRPRRRHSLSAI